MAEKKVIEIKIFVYRRATTKEIAYTLSKEKTNAELQISLNILFLNSINYINIPWAGPWACVFSLLQLKYWIWNKKTKKNNAIYLKTKFEWKDKYSFLFGVD